MKHALIITAFATTVAGADPSDYINWVRQIQDDSGVEWDVTVAPSGTMLSPEGVGPAGSLFQLWSIHNITASEFHLDEEFVSSYTPVSGVTILTGDPYEHVARTRVDQPFTVRIDVSGLLPNAGTPGGPPPAAGMVLLTHAAGNFPDGQHSFGDGGASDPGGTGSDNGSDENHPLIGSAFINGNGQMVLNYGFTSLRGPDLTKVEGEEIWTVSAINGGGPGNPFGIGEVLESAMLQVWPIADAAISGIDSVQAYEDLPPVTVTLNDLYPDSTTFVRAYFGPPVSNPEDAREVLTSYVIIQDSIPQDRILTLDDLDDYFPKVGAYTIEVLHTTPFGTELLSQFYPLNIERVITVRGAVYSNQ